MTTIKMLIDQAAPNTAVIFNGHEPRLLGMLNVCPATAADARRKVDPILLSQQLSATFISLGEYTPTGAKFVVAHG